MCDDLYFVTYSVFFIADVNVNHLLHFWTASPERTTELVVEVKELELPGAHTCLSQLYLPNRHDVFATFEQAMVLALKHKYGFGMM